MLHDHLKATYGHLRNLSSSPLVYETSPPILKVAAFDHQLYRFTVATVNNFEHVGYGLDLHVYPITKLWRNLVQAIWCIEMDVSGVF